MPQFRTHTTQEEPQVLLIGDSGRIAELAEIFFKTHGIGVIKMGVGELSRQDFNHSAQDFYKTVLLYGWSETSLPKSPDFFKRLASTSSQLVVLGRTTLSKLEPHNSRELTEAMKARVRDDEEWLSLCRAASSEASFIFGLDVWDRSSSELFPIQYFLNKDISSLTKVGGSLHSQEVEEFFKVASSQLIHSRVKNQLYYGEGFLLQEITQLWQDHAKPGKSSGSLSETELGGVFFKSWTKHLVNSSNKEFSSRAQEYLNKMNSRETSLSRAPAYPAVMFPAPSMPHSASRTNHLVQDRVVQDREFQERVSQERGDWQNRSARELRSEVIVSEGLPASTRPREKVTERVVERVQLPSLGSTRLKFLEKNTNLGKQADLRSSARHVSTVRIKPLHSPKVENRQIRYEDHKRRMELEKDLRTKLKNTTKRSSEASLNSSESDSVSKFREAERVFEKKIQSVFQSTRAVQKTERVRDLAGKVVKTLKKNSRRKKASYLLFFMVGVVLGCLAWAGVFIWSKTQVVTSFSRLSAWLSDGVYDKKPEFLAEFDKQNHFLGSQLKIIQPLLEAGSFNEEKDLASLGSVMSQTATSLVKHNEAINQAWLVLTAQQSGSGEDVVKSLNNTTTRAYQQLAFLQAELERSKNGEFSDALNSNLESLSLKLKETRKKITTNTAIQPFLPWIVGVESKRTYALVVVNNLELRGSGGLATSLGLITVDKGTITDVRTFDVSGIDRVLPGEVLPPALLSSFTGQSAFRMSDSLWSPHTPDATKQLSFFLEKSLQTKVDGVVIMDLYALKELVELVGNVRLADQNESITPDNLFERVQFHSEAKIVENGQKEYLTSILSQVLNKLVILNSPDVGTQVFSFFGNQLEQSHLAINVSNPSLSTVISGLGWTGELITPGCPTQLGSTSCITTTVMQVEENVGSNRANYELERRVDHNVMVTKDGLRHERIIALRNKSSSTAWPRGTYRSYLRLYVPTGTTLEKVEVDGAQVAKPNIYEGEEGGKHYFGVLVEVEILKTQTVKFLYSESRQLQTPFSLSLFDQKQIGTGDDSLRTTIYFSPDFTPHSVAPKPLSSKEKLVFTSPRSKHSIVGVTFR